MSSSPFGPISWQGHQLQWGQQTHVMGIVNATPDSFSGDGIRNADLSEDSIVQHAVERATQFVAEGASCIDVGGESTRPHAANISVEEELARVLPVIRALRAALPVESIISIDTYKAQVAEQALVAGASMINDIWAMTHDPAMVTVAADHKVPVVLMANMRDYRKRNIMSDIVRFLSQAIDHALAANVAWEHIIIDPGIGFGTTPEENLTVLRHLHQLRVLGRPILLGVSRKSTIGLVLGGAPVSQRLEGTLAAVALGIEQGADIVRVHDVHETMRVVKMSDAIVRGTFQHPGTW
jgi:dihydropteroate synthase